MPNVPSGGNQNYASDRLLRPPAKIIDQTFLAARLVSRGQFERSRANGTNSAPAIATQASIAQASLTHSAREAFSTIGRTNATVASSGGPGGRFANVAALKPIAFAAVTSPSSRRTRKY